MLEFLEDQLEEELNETMAIGVSLSKKSLQAVNAGLYAVDKNFGDIVKAGVIYSVADASGSKVAKAVAIAYGATKIVKIKKDFDEHLEGKVRVAQPLKINDDKVDNKED